jgi:hypothetical protein
MKARKLMIGAAAIAMACMAQNAHARVAYICPTLDQTTGELEVQVKSGCISSSLSLIEQNLALEVDQNYAMINVTGDMTFGGGGRIVTSDCMGGQTITLSAQEIEARDYVLLFNGQRIDNVDFTDPSFEAECLSAGGPTRADNGTINRSVIKGYNDNPIEGWRDWRGSSVFDLLSPVLDGHPETMEGRATTTIKMSKESWRREYSTRPQTYDRSPFIAVRITQGGYLDDSVSGGRIFAEVRMDENGQWKLDGLWGQYKCARGSKAGQWTGGRCI